MRQTLFKSIAALMCVSLLSGCFTNNRKPGWEYMPDMAHSVAYDAYSSSPISNQGTNRLPVKGTVPLYEGYMGKQSNYTPYTYSNSTTGYDSAGLYVKSPFPASPETLAEGERLYMINCAVCHGQTGEGNGPIVVNDKIVNTFPPPPSYFSEQLINLPEGKMFHTIQYGKNLMGSYASQVDRKEAWMIIHYIQALQAQHKMKEAGKETSASATEGAAAPAQTPAATTQTPPQQNSN